MGRDLSNSQIPTPQRQGSGSAAVGLPSLGLPRIAQSAPAQPRAIRDKDSSRRPRPRRRKKAKRSRQIVRNIQLITVMRRVDWEDVRAEDEKIKRTKLKQKQLQVSELNLENRTSELVLCFRQPSRTPSRLNS